MEGEQSKEKPVFESYLEDCNRVKKEIKGSPEVDRVAIVISAYDSGKRLQTTIREFSQQCMDARRKVDFFIVLNNGGGNTKQEVTALQTEYTSAAWILHNQEKASDDPHQSGEYQTSTNQPTDASITFHIINQAKHPNNDGKIRGLRDAYSIMYQLNQSAAYHPKYIIAADDETRLRYLDETGLDKKNTTLANTTFRGNPLNELLTQLDQNYTLTFIGARSRLTPFDKDGIPHFEQTVPPWQLTVNMIHGKSGYQWLPGGATIGRFTEMLSIMYTMSQRFPKLKTEDIMCSATAEKLGYISKIAENIVHANRCPEYTTETMTLAAQQIGRWLSANEGIKQVAGQHALDNITASNLFQMITHNGLGLIKDDPIRYFNAVLSLPPYILLTEEAKKTPDDITDSHGSAGW